ncbi:MAG: hypothetical protein KGJ86_13235, partial [Chloroflexota bacterium]|nr:hypothetical protein [Chloroflexota bacterium]
RPSLACGYSHPDGARQHPMIPQIDQYLRGLDRPSGLRIRILREGNADGWPQIKLLELPSYIRISTNMVKKGIAENWLKAEGYEVVHAPAGPESDPWRASHTFETYTRLVFKTVDGDITYRVTIPPRKYQKPDGTWEVEWFHDAVLER